VLESKPDDGQSSAGPVDTAVRCQDLPQRVHDNQRGIVADLYHYVVVRLDVPRGVQAAQIIHAAGESACLAGEVPPGTNAVALGVPSEARLLELGRTLTAAGIPHCQITETEGTFAGQVMAIGCAPAAKAKLKKFFSSIPLIKEVPCLRHDHD